MNKTQDTKSKLQTTKQIFRGYILVHTRTYWTYILDKIPKYQKQKQNKYRSLETLEII